MGSKKHVLNLLVILCLIIGYCWAENGEHLSAEERIVTFLHQEARELDDTEDLSFLIESVKDKKLVLLGEASHGTSEYYSWRKKISRRLIEEKNFSFIVVEGDWPGCFAVNRYVKGKIEVEDVSAFLVESFHRWPRWMWANEDVLALVEWLRNYNDSLPLEERVGFYGMDMQCFDDSIMEVKNYLRRFEDETLLELKEKYRVFEAYNYDGFAYARAVYTQRVNHRNEVEKVYHALRERSEELKEYGKTDYFSAKQNALIVKNAEDYFRKAVIRGPAGWNTRVRHMEETVYRLLDHYGPGSKGIVWAHNTHVGDARATSMIDRGQVNIGQLIREELGENNVFIVGFSTFQGTVMAGREWGAPRQVMRVPPAMESSIDNLLSHVDRDTFWLFLTAEAREHEELLERRGQRAIGVVYNPEREQPGNYVPTSLPERYDALLFFRETRTVNPLD